MPSRRDAIHMTEDEVRTFLETTTRWLQVATIGKNGLPQLTTVNFLFAEGMIYFNGYKTSQRNVNLHRNPAVGVLVEDGVAYNEMRGVCFQGYAEFIDDPQESRRLRHLIGAQRALRMTGEATSAQTARPASRRPEEARDSHDAPVVDKREWVGVRPVKVYSWDHSKLPTGVH